MSHSEQSSTRPTLACLIISRTPNLINRLLASIPASRHAWCDGDQVLCSWNGSIEAKTQIKAPDPLAFKIVCRDHYDFSANINTLARFATSDYVCLLNDDVILDPGCLDVALEILEQNPGIGVVGGRLRTSTGLLSHAGILLSPEGLPYNRFHPDQLDDLVDHTVLVAQQDGDIPAVTAALMVLRRQDLIDVPMRELFEISGQDVCLCLDIWQRLGKTTFYAANCTAIHNERTTRGLESDLHDRDRVGLIARKLGEHPSNGHWLYAQSEFFFHLLLASADQIRKTTIEQHHILNELAAVQKEVEALRASTSWLVTKPIRMASRLYQWLGYNRKVNPASHQQVSTSTDTASSIATVGSFNIVFDTLILGHARVAKVSRGGIYRYSSELLNALHELCGESLSGYCSDQIYAQDSEAELASICGLSRSSPSLYLSPSLIPAPLKAFLKPVYRRYRQSMIANSDSMQRWQDAVGTKSLSRTIYHTPFQSVPNEIRQLQPYGILLTIHDLIPLIYPEFFTRETINHFHTLLSGLRSTDHVVCVSQSSKSDFQRFFPDFPESHIHVTYLAAAPELQPVVDSHKLLEFRSRIGLADTEQIILSLCTLEPRKNLHRLVQAFELFLQNNHDRGFKLVLAGSLGWKMDSLSQMLEQSSSRDHILVTGHIDDHDLPSLYSIADLFVYPSLYEGFGLPPLEAMQCGTPVIVGQHSSLPEVVGDAGVYVNPRSVEDIAAAIAYMMNNPKQRQHFREAALRQSKKFCWAYTAQQTLAIYESILNQ